MLHFQLDASLTDTSFTDVHFTDASLTNASLTDVSLTDVSLTDVSLTDASLTDPLIHLLLASLTVISEWLMSIRVSSNMAGTDLRSGKVCMCLMLVHAGSQE